MISTIAHNFAKLKLSLYGLPLLGLLAVVGFLYINNALNVAGYVQVQKEYFYFVNLHLSQFPVLEINLTQFGDAVVFLSFLSVLFVYAPKIWEALLSATIVSAVFAGVFKNVFYIPRPAEAFDNNSFTIIGKTLVGFSSLPSGHSITIFTVLSVLLFALMPKLLKHKIMWVFAVITVGLILVSTRIGVGAHHPFDVLIGSIFGYLSGISGIFISRKYKIWSWISNKKYYSFFIILFIFGCVSIITDIMNQNLIVFYLALMCLLFSLYKIILVYVKK